MTMLNSEAELLACVFPGWNPEDKFSHGPVQISC